MEAMGVPESLTKKNPVLYQLVIFSKKKICLDSNNTMTLVTAKTTTATAPINNNNNIFFNNNNSNSSKNNKEQHQKQLHILKEQYGILNNKTYRGTARNIRINNTKKILPIMLV